MGGPINMERKGYESIGCYAYFVTLSYDLDLGFSSQILKLLYLRNGRADWHGTKGMWVDRMLDPHCVFELWPHPWPWPLIFKVKSLKSRNSGMGGPINMERKGYESIGCYAYFVTLSYELDLGFSRLNFETAASKEWEGRLTWNKRDVSRQDVRPTLWLWIVTSPMTLTLDFQGHFFFKVVTREWEGRSTWNERDMNV